MNSIRLISCHRHVLIVGDSPSGDADAVASAMSAADSCGVNPARRSSR